MMLISSIIRRTALSSQGSVLPTLRFAHNGQDSDPKSSENPLSDALSSELPQPKIVVSTSTFIPHRAPSHHSERSKRSPRSHNSKHSSPHSHSHPQHHSQSSSSSFTSPLPASEPIDYEFITPYAQKRILELPLSSSKINDFMRCPQFFKYKYLTHPAYTTQVSQQVKEAKGDIVHDALDTLAKESTRVYQKAITTTDGDVAKAKKIAVQEAKQSAKEVVHAVAQKKAKQIVKTATHKIQTNLEQKKTKLKEKAKQKIKATVSVEEKEKIEKELEDEIGALAVDAEREEKQIEEQVEQEVEKATQAAVDAVEVQINSAAERYGDMLHSELEFKVAISGIPVEGAFDRIYRHPETGQITIVEDKADLNDKRLEARMKASFQHWIYARAYSLMPDGQIPHRVVMRSAASGTCLERLVQPSDLKRVDLLVLEVSKAIEAAVYPPRPTEYTCQSCRYAYMCPFSAHKDSENSVVKMNVKGMQPKEVRQPEKKQQHHPVVGKHKHKHQSKHTRSEEQSNNDSHRDESAAIDMLVKNIA